MMGDMKEHFQTATNTVAAHNAAMLQEAWDHMGSKPESCAASNTMQPERNHRHNSRRLSHLHAFPVYINLHV